MGMGRERERKAGDMKEIFSRGRKIPITSCKCLYFSIGFSPSSLPLLFLSLSLSSISFFIVSGL